MSAINNTHSTYKKIGEQIKNARAARGLTREKFCSQINEYIDTHENSLNYLDPNTFRYWESGEHKINLEYIDAIRYVLNVDVGYLFGEYDTFLRENADIAAETGLSEDAVNFLRERSPKNDPYILKPHGAISSHEALSAIITDSDFWRIINSISSCSSPDMQCLLDSMIYTTDPFPSNDINSTAYEKNLILDRGPDSMIAGLAHVFGNIAERILGWK